MNEKNDQIAHFIIVTKPGIACVVSQISNSPGPGRTPHNGIRNKTARFDASIWIARCSGPLRISKTSCSISGHTSTIIARILPWEGEHLTQDAPTPRPVANLHSYGWQGHCRGLYHTPMAA